MFNIQCADIAVLAYGVENFLFDRDSGLFYAEWGKENSEEFDSNVYEFIGARAVVSKDMAALGGTIQVHSISSDYIQGVSQNWWLSL